MPRGSRSSRKQPDFDPSELDDLIFSPAVGTGVGSHLMERTPPFPAPTSGMSDAPDSTRSRSATPTIVVIPNRSTVATETTVDTFTQTTVVATDSSTVEAREQAAAKPEDGSNYGPTAVPEMATVDILDMPTVVMHNRTTVEPNDMATVDISHSTTVDMSIDIGKSSPEESIAAADTIRVATVDDIDMATEIGRALCRERV